MSRSRRSVLAGCTAGLAALSGCQRAGFGASTEIDLKIANYTADEQALKLTLLREDEGAYSDAEAMKKEYTVPAPGAEESAGVLRRENVAPERRYLVRVLLKHGGFERFHAHYYPASSGEARIQFDVRRDETTTDLYVDFRSL